MGPLENEDLQNAIFNSPVFSKIATDANGVIQSAMIEPQAQKSGIRLNFALCDEPCFVEADRMRVRQIRPRRRTDEPGHA